MNYLVIGAVAVALYFLWKKQTEPGAGTTVATTTSTRTQGITPIIRSGDTSVTGFQNPITGQNDARVVIDTGGIRRPRGTSTRSGVASDPTGTITPIEGPGGPSSNILWGNPLTLPSRSGWGAGLTNAEVQTIIASNEAARAIVQAAGGVDAWIAKTNGGTLDPSLWPFTLPQWPLRH